MIRVVMLGRVGNNFFQYAMGRVLAEHHGVPLVMDASWFNREGWAQVSCLRRLPMRADVVRRVSLGSRALLKTTGKHYWEYRGVPVLKEAPLDQSFDRSFLEAPEDCVLMGYFQTALYFSGIEDEIRRELYLKVAVEKRVGFVLPTGLRDEGSVAVHVRRTDFVTHPAFGVCGLSYYRRAMDRLRELVPGARFYLFSDDPGWCRRKFQGVEVVDLPGACGDPLHDLHLMSLARHQIIANSSYSWWAAWLGKKEGQRVLCPSRWMNGKIKVPITQKLRPGWETVEVDKRNNHEE